MFSVTPSQAVYSERRVRFLHRRIPGGIRADIASEWTRIIDEIDEVDGAVDVGENGDAVVTRKKGHFTKAVKEALRHWKEWSVGRRKRRVTTDVGVGESRVPLDAVAGNDIVDATTAVEVQVLPRPPRGPAGWGERQVKHSFHDRKKQHF